MLKIKSPVHFLALFLYLALASSILAQQPTPTPTAPTAPPVDRAAAIRTSAAPDTTPTTIDQARPDAATSANRNQRPALTPVEDRTVTTRHTARIGNRLLSYTATTGTLVLRKEDGAPRANIFFIAYTRDAVPAAARRPVTFSFNGGPGSSSVWLHLGALGPKRVVTDKEGNPATPPPFNLEDNNYSMLDETDLVFIDPVGTGFSRAVAGEDPKQFYSFNGDIESVADFIRLYTTRYQRWGSPKFLAGESYGTLRAAALSGYLQNRFGMYINGIMLISSVLDFTTIRFERNNMMPYMLYLPSYTATAWYHKRLAPDLQADLQRTLREVEAFVTGEYAQALMRGTTISTQERTAVVAKLARYTGLTPAYIEQTDLLLSQPRFSKELLRDNRRTVGRLDSRFTGIDFDAAGEATEYDPSYSVIQGIYSTTFNHYVRADLRYENDLPYEILTGRVQPWSYANSENRFVSSADTLRAAMTQNPALRVFVASGYYDLATPYFATMHTFSHLGLDSSLRSHITMDYYEAGHMLYMHEPSLVKLKNDMNAFLRSATRNPYVKSVRR